MIVYAADNHLQQQAWKDRPSLRGDAFYSFQQLCEFARVGDGGHPAEALILAGDVIDDSDPDPLTLGFLLDELRKLYGVCPVYFTVGNHDRHQGGVWLGLSEWATHLHMKTVQIGRYNIFGLDWQSATNVKHMLDNIPAEANTLVAHQVWEELCPRPECSLADVPHVSMVLSGDYHRQTVVSGTGKTGQQVTLLSPGSAAMQSTQEPPEKGFYVLHQNGLHDSVSYLTRQCEKFQVTTADELEQVLNTPLPYSGDLPADLQRPIRVVSYPDSLQTAYAALTEKFSETTHLFLLPRCSSNVMASQQSMDAIVSNTLIEALFKLELEDSNPRTIVEALLRCEDDREQAIAMLAKLETRCTSVN